MNPRRFVGANSRDVLQQVRAVLGEDPFIVSNRKVPEGVEIVAVGEAEVVQAGDWSAASLEAREMTKQVTNSLKGLDTKSLNELLLDEVRGMKALLLGEPENSAASLNQEKLESSLRRSGFTAELSADISQCFASSKFSGDWQLDEITPWVSRQVELRLPEARSGKDLLREGGVLALIGPTGVGKTTTTAKLAAQIVMAEGPKDVAIVSMDNFRVGAHEQLRIYAKLLGVEFYALEEKDSLERILKRLQRKKLVLIDTAGLSQRDERVAEQFREMTDLDTKIKFLLLLNGTSQTETLDEVVNCYRSSLESGGVEVEDCILTKIDEATSPNVVLGSAIEHQLNPVFVSAGQRVPEDIDGFDLTGLIEKPLRESLEQEQGTIQKPAASWSRHLLTQGRQLGAILRVLRENIEGFSHLEDLWDISARPRALQQSVFDTLMQQRVMQASGERGIAWAATRPIRGCYFQCPDMVLGESGGLLPISFLQHRQPLDDLQRLSAVSSGTQADWHVFSSLPSEKLRRWLYWEGKPWMSDAGSKSGLKQRLRDMEPAAEFYDEVPLQFKGQAARLQITSSSIDSSILEVDSDSMRSELSAWFGRVRSVERAADLEQFQWIGTAQGDVGRLLKSQLSLSSFPSLVRKGWFYLEAIPDFQFCRDLRISVAAGMAATTINLEMSEEDWATELRGRICDIHGSKKRINQNSIFEALSYLLLAREAFNHGLTN